MNTSIAVLQQPDCCSSKASGKGHGDTPAPCRRSRKHCATQAKARGTLLFEWPPRSEREAAVPSTKGSMQTGFVVTVPWILCIRSLLQAAVRVEHARGCETVLRCAPVTRAAKFRLIIESSRNNRLNFLAGRHLHPRLPRDGECLASCSNVCERPLGRG